MSKALDELQLAVKQLLAEKTFSPEALEAVKELNASYKSALKEIEGLNDEVDDMSTKLTQLSKDFSTISDQNAILRANESSVAEREKAVSVRETKQDVVDKVAEMHEIRVGDMQNMMHLIFRNPTIRKSLRETVPVMPQKDQYNNQIFPTTVSIEKTEEINEQ